MGFLDHFFGNALTKEKEFASRLHQKIENLLPNHNEEYQLKLACLSGLLARVAYADMDIAESEREKIAETLKKWTELSDHEIDVVSNLACDEVIDLSGLENTRYCHPLSEIMTHTERFSLLKALFAIAAADGSVEHVESEEIRHIAKGLLLEHKHYISARATVLDKLKALQKFK